MARNSSKRECAPAPSRARRQALQCFGTPGRQNKLCIRSRCSGVRRATAQFRGGRLVPLLRNSADLREATHPALERGSSVRFGCAAIRGSSLWSARSAEINSAFDHDVRACAARRRRRNSAVASLWHCRQSVRMLARSHSPPPSTTGTIWSASHKWRRPPHSFSNRRRAM